MFELNKGRFGRWGTLGSAYNNSLTLMEKIKLLKEMVNDLYENETELNTKLDELLKWLENGMVESYVVEKLDKMVSDGSLNKIINTEIFSELNNEMLKIRSAVTEMFANVKYFGAKGEIGRAHV